MNEQNCMKFKVQSFRKIPNPYLLSQLGDTRPTMYFAICDVKDLPENFSMKTNPREQKMTTSVAKKIKNSLLDTSALDFYLLNRGLLLSAKEVTFNTYSEEITIVFENMDVHGNVDGGHTYRTILDYRDELEPGQQFVKLEILTGVESIFQDLAAARNTSVQVQDKSIAELENRFDIIKHAIINEPFYEQVFFKENDKGDIDVTDILAILNMFNLDRYGNNMDSFPTVSYSFKKICIDYYIQTHKELGESPSNPYVKMSGIIPDIFKLYDHIETRMNTFYRKKNSAGHYGAVKGVIVPHKGQYLQSKFYRNKLDIGSPTGFIYPILGAFRALLKEENGAYVWRQNPFAVLEKVGPEMVETTIERSRSLGNNPQSTGKDTGNWKTLYMTVMLHIR